LAFKAVGIDHRLTEHDAVGVIEAARRQTSPHKQPDVERMDRDLADLVLCKAQIHVHDDIFGDFQSLRDRIAGENVIGEGRSLRGSRNFVTAVWLGGTVHRE